MKRITHSGAADPRADDVLAGAEDINDSAEIRERGPSVGNGGSADGDDAGCTGGRGSSCINIGVSGGDLRETSSTESQSNI